MSRPSSTSTASANTFPRPAGAALVAPEALADQLSPTRSTFSFDSSPKSATFADRGLTFEENKTTRALSHGAPGEKKDSGVQQTRSQNYGSRQRTQYYEDRFSYKEDWTSSARDRVSKDAPIVAELRTNVIIKDEYTLVTDLSHQLSSRYHRPESSIMITVNHSACLLLAGSFEPTYILTLTALPVHVQATTNKRNASLLQTFLSETLGVHPERGIIKFMAIPEDNFATNGNTILGEIERLEREQVDESGNALKRALTKSSRRSAVKSKSSIQLSRGNSKADNSLSASPPLPSPSPFDSGVSMDEKYRQLQSSSKPAIKKDTSIHKKSSKVWSSEPKPPKISLNNLSPPPIPEDSPAPKIGKRKSFVSIFKR
ncbi:Tautomerase/MIF [Delitschia confertaspora ATCC 74209]|uniref:L-dopachrome isomerase n=1 Tax=Delitschia confertaspora ATCC 74209 TaxID=1513339 RepID=A0A9P4JEK8_9PLEO|nr:Tautomerase/MIF [Delitschia confertaspora ATCC 74209]